RRTPFSRLSLHDALPISDCPVPPIAPLEDVCVNQLAAGATVVFHDSGQTQLPVPVNMTVCAAGLADAPCTALKERALDEGGERVDRKSTRLNSSHEWISY